MLSRATAWLLAVALTVLTATPAVATVECHQHMAACGHCLKAPKQAAPPQVKGECCFLKAPASQEQAAPAGHHPAPGALALALDQSLPQPMGALSARAVEGTAAGPAPPPLQRTQPLLH